MTVVFTGRARRELKRLDSSVRDRIIAGLNRLAETGHGDVSKLTDVDPPEYRLRIGGYRVRFARDAAAGVLTVLRVLPRGAAYR